MMVVNLPVAQYQRDTAIEPVANMPVNRLRSGAVKSSSIASDYWKAEFLTAPMSRGDVGKWNAFFMQHGDAKSSVLLGHPHECLPMDYATFEGVNVAGGGQFDGTGAIFSIGDLQNITVNQLPSLFSLKAGDWLGIEEDGRATLHKVMEDVVGDAGGQASISFLPPMSLARTNAALVRFENPVGEFIIETGSVRRHRMGAETAIGFTATSRAE